MSEPAVDPRNDAALAAGLALGLRGADLRAVIPSSSPLPAWAVALESEPSQGARVRALAPRLYEIATALDATRPSWR